MHFRFIQGAEAVAIFSQSGLDMQILRGIWTLADEDKDSKLSKLEFQVAFHLIVCIRYHEYFILMIIRLKSCNRSKRGLPLPPGLPSPLRAYLASGGIVTPPVAPQPQSAAVTPPPKQLSVSDAFGNVEINQTSNTKTSNSAVSAANPTSAENVGNVATENEAISSGISGLADASRKLVGTQASSLEVLTMCIYNEDFI